MSVWLTFASYRPITHTGESVRFRKIFEAADGIYEPEFLELKDRGLIPWTEARESTFDQAWSSGAVVLTRSRPVKVDTIVAISDRGSVLPNDVSLSVQVSYFSPSEKLGELLRLGTTLYEFLSACCGFLTLPWLPKLRNTSLPERGLPGLGWATWLGPEYRQLLTIPHTKGVTVEDMIDGGVLIRLELPRYVGDPDPAIRRTYDDLIHLLNPQVFQSSGDSPSVVPKFRYRS